MRILKFGGTSVATAARRLQVAGIVRQAAVEGPVAVVTSALAGVTDSLERALAKALDGAMPHLDRLAARHLTETADLPEASDVRRTLRERLAELATLLSGVAALGECPASARHRVLACGERLALPLLAAALRRQGLRARAVDAADLLVAPHSDGGPVLDAAASRQRVRDFWDGLCPGEVAVVTGFIAGDGEGDTTTLGRGASDLTATLLARFLDAAAVEIWSDVDGVLSAPPQLVPSALPLEELSYDEAAGLAAFGARVLHPEALAPVAEAGIPVWVRNTLRPETPGTRIAGTRFAAPSIGGWLEERVSAAGAGTAIYGSIRALAAVTGVCRLRLTAPWPGRDLLGRVFRSLDEDRLRPLAIDRGGATCRQLDLVIRISEADRIERTLARRPGCDGWTSERSDDLAAVAMVGAGDPWVAGEVLGVLRREGVAPLSVSSMAAEPGVCAVVVVPADACVRAVRALHDALVRRPIDAAFVSRACPPAGTGTIRPRG